MLTFKAKFYSLFVTFTYTALNDLFFHFFFLVICYRTHTIVTVDVEDNVTFIESTKLEAFDEPSKWQTSRFQFKIS